jgi:hypothetical protein
MQCMDPGHFLQLCQSIDTVIEVPDEANEIPELCKMMEAYLSSQGQCTMEDYSRLWSHFIPLAIAINNLGWDCMVEGRILYILIKAIKPMLWQYKPRGSINLWGAKLIKSVVSKTHKQWLYRNNGVHQVSNGLTAKQHQELSSWVQELLMTKKESLLERHCHFMDMDFTKLGSGPMTARQVWVANVEMAINFAKVAKDNFCSQAALQQLHTPLPLHPSVTLLLCQYLPSYPPHEQDKEIK